MTCFEGGFRRALFFLENSRKRPRAVVPIGPRRCVSKSLILGPILNLFLSVSAPSA